MMNVQLVKLLANKEEKTAEEQRTLLMSLENELSQKSEVLKVKEKMLEDQNDTIVSLKHELKDKANELESVKKSFKKDTQKLENDLADQIELNKSQKQVVSQCMYIFVYSNIYTILNPL